VVNDPKTVAEQLDAAKDGEEFGQVLMGFFSALAKQREDDEYVERAYHSRRPQ